MPVYEYRCRQCRRKSALFVRTASRQAEPVCQHCGSRDLSRLFSTFAVHRSEGGGADDGDDGGDLGDLDDFNESDPKAMARMMRKMGGGMREEMGPEFDQVVERMEAGETPEEMENGGDLDEDGGIGSADDDFEA